MSRAAAERHRGVAGEVRDAVLGRRDRFLALLEALTMAESPSAAPASHTGVRGLLREALAEAGLVVREHGAAGGPRHLFARSPRRRPGGPFQLLLGHFDTVWPLGTTQHRPFHVAGGRAAGPGVFDMKGGLAQLVVALEAARELNLAMPVAPVALLNADEEIGSRSSTRAIAALARRCDRALVLEPALGPDGALKTERKGVGRFTITVTGRAAHAGLDPQGGASAILELSHVIQRLFALNDGERGVTVNVGTIDGGLQPNVIAPHGKAVVDVRVPTVADGAAIERAIHALEPATPGVRLDVSGCIGRPAMEATPANRALWDRARALGDALGLALNGVRAGGGSDGNTASQFTATLDGLGPVGDGAHAEHEHLDIERTLQRAALLVLLLTAPPLGPDA